MPDPTAKLQRIRRGDSEYALWATLGPECRTPVVRDEYAGGGRDPEAAVGSDRERAERPIEQRTMPLGTAVVGAPENHLGRSPGGDMQGIFASRQGNHASEVERGWQC